jgi:hypothetical protein
LDAQKVKLFAAVVMIAAAVGIFFFQGGGGPEDRRVTFVCVETGDFYTYKVAKAQTEGVPLENPDTGKRTVLPVVEKEGMLVIDAHWAPLLHDSLREANQVVDPKTLEVKSD